jgi:hypothetical protein
MWQESQLMHSLSSSVATATVVVAHGFGHGIGPFGPVMASGREDLNDDAGVFLSSVVRECPVARLVTTSSMRPWHVARLGVLFPGRIFDPARRACSFGGLEPGRVSLENFIASTSIFVEI